MDVFCVDILYIRSLYNANLLVTLSNIYVKYLDIISKGEAFNALRKMLPSIIDLHIKEYLKILKMED